MADAKKCDRCGAFYAIYYGKNDDDPPWNTVDERCISPYSNNQRYQRYELCPSCSRYIHAVLSTPPETPAKQ